MKDEDTRYPTVTKEAVYFAASRFVESAEKIPALTELRHHFATPTSPAIAVYFAEWREENADLIRLHNGGKEAWKAHALKLETELADERYRLAVIDNELTQLKDWLSSEHGEVLGEWESFDESEELELCKTP